MEYNKFDLKTWLSDRARLGSCVTEVCCDLPEAIKACTAHYEGIIKQKDEEIERLKRYEVLKTWISDNLKWDYSKGITDKDYGTKFIKATDLLAFINRGK